MYMLCLTTLNKPIVIQGRLQFAIKSRNIKSISAGFSLKSFISTSTTTTKTKAPISQHTSQKIISSIRSLLYRSGQYSEVIEPCNSPPPKQKNYKISDQKHAEQLEYVEKALEALDLPQNEMKGPASLKDVSTKLDGIVGKISTSNDTKEHNQGVRSVQDVCFECMFILFKLNKRSVSLKQRKKYQHKTINLYEKLRKTASWVEYATTTTTTITASPKEDHEWTRFHRQELHLCLTFTNYDKPSWEILLGCLKRKAYFNDDFMVEKAIHILSTQIFGNKRFGEDERYVMRKILKRLKRSPLIFSELCYSQLSYLLRDYGTVEDIELLEVYHDGICSKIKERGLNSKKAQSVAANLLTIEIIIMYNLKGKEDYARHLLETKVKKDFPNTLKFTSREDWATFIEMILVIGDKQLCQIVNYTNLAQSPLKMFTYTVDRAIKHYMSTGDYEKVDKYLDFRFRNKCSILYNTPDIVTRRLFETKPFSEAFLATMRHGFHLHMGTDKSLPIISQIIREMDKDQMNQFFKEIFAAKDVSPEHIMQHLETVRIFSGVKNIVSEAQNYVLSIEPDLINRLNVEKFIFRVIYTKTVMVNAYRKGKFLAPRSDICKILIILLRHITAVKRQSGAGEDYSGDFYQGKVMSFGNVVDIYNPNTAENILKNNSYWYHRITISLSSKIERVLLRESLRLGANLGWEAVNSMIYHRVIHQRFEEAHRLMISVLNDIPRTSVIWIRRTSPEEAVKSMVYGLALSIYNYMGRSDMTKFITKTIFGMYPKFGLLHRFIFQGMVSIYIDSIGHDENSTVEDLKREWNWIMDYGTKISANRLNKASVPVDTKLLVLDGYIWSERRIAGLDSNNCLSYAEALVKKGAPDEALKFICQDMPQMRLKLDPKFIINMVSYFNNPKYYRHLAMVCRYFIRNHPNIVVIAAKKISPKDSIYKVLANCVKRLSLEPKLRHRLT